MTTSTADRSRDLVTGSAARVALDTALAVPRSDDLRTDPAAEPTDSLVEQLSRAQYAAVAATIIRRRSLTDSLQVAFTVYWDTVIATRDDQLAVRTGTGAIATDRRPSRRPGAPERVSGWLGLIIDVHQMRWELPDAQVALLVSATFEGLTVDYLASGNPQPARAVLQVLAYQVGRYGRRPAKNQQH